MAIAFDAVSTDSTVGSAASSQTFAHTCTGSDIVLVVGVNLLQETAISGITYNGVALTQFTGGAVNAVGGSPYRTELWYLLDPATGANNIVITHGGSVEAWSVGVSYTGVGSVDATAEATTADFGTSVTDDISSASGDLVVGLFGNTAKDPVVGAGQTSRASINTNGTICGMFSDEPGAATVTMSHSWTLNRFSTQVIANLNAAASAASPLLLFSNNLNGGLR